VEDRAHGPTVSTAARRSQAPKRPLPGLRRKIVWPDARDRPTFDDSTLLAHQDRKSSRTILTAVIGSVNVCGRR
jgi:hypothetical protein